MNATTIELSTREQAAEARRAQDEARGYRINLKYLGIAAAGETIVILTSLYGAWLFAKMYASGDITAMHMMLLAPISYAVIEMSRVPLAVAFRTQKSLFIKLLCFVGVIAAAGVTIKSMSQLGEIMFRPRLIQVTETHHLLKKAEDERKTFGERRAAADAEVARLTEEKMKAQEAANTQALDLKNAPKQVCNRQSIRDNRGRPTGSFRTVCNTPPAATAMVTAANAATDSLKTVSARLDQATANLNSIGSSGALDNKVTEAKKAFDNAVLHSQLHAFTGMFFGKAPSEVTEGELSGFLRIFVFVPAICVSLASTFLAIASVTRIKPKKTRSGLFESKTAEGEKLLIPAAGMQYILGPLYKTMIETSAEAARRAAQETLEKSHPAQKPDLKVVSEGDRR